MPYFFEDASHTNDTEWLSAKQEDIKFISKYASENPGREDFSESFVPFLALKYRRHRISETQAREIKITIPNRLAYFKNKAYDLFPIAVIDIDKNNYPIAKIGTQLWMAENLKVTKCNDGQPLQVLTIGQSSSSEGMYWHNDSPTSLNSLIYGPLYNWTTVKNCNVCPTGWHVPSQDEWNLALRYWYNKQRDDGSTIEVGAEGLTYAAYQLREKGNNNWSNNDKATNATGFSARPGGWLWNGKFYYLRSRTAWWAPRNSNKTPFMTKIANENNGTWTASASSKDILYIRCVKDN